MVRWILGLLTVGTLGVTAFFIIQKKTPGSSFDGDTAVIHLKKSAIDPIKTEIKAIFDDVQVAPNLDGEIVKGFKVLESKPGGVGDLFGIKKGDILLKINNIDQTSPVAGMEAIGSLKADKSNFLELQRDGKPLQIEYVLDP